MNPINEFYDAARTLDRIARGKDKIKETFDKQKSTINHSYNEAIHTLERKRDEELQELDNQKQTQLTALESEGSSFYSTITKTKRIIKFMHLYVNQGPVITAEAPKVSYYRHYDDKGKYLFGSDKKEVTASPVATIRNDQYNQIHIYIIPNKKSVNKFSLVIRGSCPLKGFEDVWKARIGIDLKDAPSEEALLEYMERNLGKLKDKIDTAQLDQLKEEYEASVTLFASPVWKTFYFERRMYYYEHGVSGGKSNQEYSDYRAIYEQFKKNHKDLPLLINAVQSEEGKQVLEFLLKN